jgi:uncharacterized protein with GYD domain
MAKYLIEETTTRKAAAGVLQNPEDRNKAIKPLFEAVGCSLEQFYLSGNENKAYLIVESPDLENVSTVMAAIQAGGSLSSFKISLIKPVAEAVDVFKKAASLTYRPPGK